MSPRSSDRNEWDEGDESWRDEPSDDDFDEPTVPCPYCRREIHEDAERCPYCEQYLSAEDAPPKPKPWWLIAGVLACLYVIYRWIFG
jgi:hypothetical protein